MADDISKQLEHWLNRDRLKDVIKEAIAESRVIKDLEDRISRMKS